MNRFTIIVVETADNTKPLGKLELTKWSSTIVINLHIPHGVNIVWLVDDQLDLISDERRPFLNDLVRFERFSNHNFHQIIYWKKIFI